MPQKGPRNPNSRRRGWQWRELLTDKRSKNSDLAYLPCKHCTYLGFSMDEFDAHTEAHGISDQMRTCTLLRCDDCNFLAQNHTEFREHRTSVHGFIFCPVCPFSTTKRKYAKIHRRTCFSPVCPDCKGPYTRGETTNNHVCPMKEGPGVPTAEELNALLENSKKVSSAPNVRYLPEKDVYTCIKCMIEFSTLQKTESHVILMHDSYTCHICPFKSTGYHCFMKHLKYKHPRQYNPYREDKPFDTCDLTFVTKYASCPFCHYTPNKADNLRKHLVDTHHMGNPKRLTCDFCDATFISHSSLYIHKKCVHFKVPRPIKNCPKCDYTSRYDHNLKAHIQSHGDFEVQCPEESCSYVNSSMVQLKKHLKTKHPEVNHILRGKIP